VKSEIEYFELVFYLLHPGAKIETKIAKKSSTLH